MNSKLIEIAVGIILIMSVLYLTFQTPKVKINKIRYNGMMPEKNFTTFTIYGTVKNTNWFNIYVNSLKYNVYYGKVPPYRFIGKGEIKDLNILENNSTIFTSTFKIYYSDLDKRLLMQILLSGEMDLFINGTATVYNLPMKLPIQYKTTIPINSEVLPI